MKFSYGQLEATLSHYLRIQPDRVSTFRARLKQLQRLQFPPGVNVGRGAKMGYSAEHLFMLVSAFELISFGMPAKFATDLVVRHWTHFSAGYGLASLNERSFETPNRYEQVLAVLTVRSMAEIQFFPVFSEGESSVTIMDEAAARPLLSPHKYHRDYSQLFMGLTLIVRRVLEAASNVAGVEEASVYNDEFLTWLPEGKTPHIRFKTRYPDRRNIEMRKELHATFGNDPDASTPDGQEEADYFQRELSGEVF